MRQALFDYLGDLIESAHMLDLYSGSGGLGFEALSRGAKSVWFVDLSVQAIKTVKENGEILGMSSQMTCILKDVFRFLRWYDPALNGMFDIIMASPPYKISEPNRLLTEIADSGVLKEGGIVCLEYARHTAEPSHPAFVLDRKKVYGETVVDLYDYVQPSVGIAQNDTE